MLYTHWITSIGQLPSNFRNISDIFNVQLTELAFRIFMRIGYILAECGLWLLPLTSYLILQSRKNFLRENKISIIISLIFILPLIRVFRLMPLGNIINDLHIGPILTFDYYILKTANIFSSNPHVLILYQLTAFMGGVFLIFLISKQLQQIFYTIKNKNADRDNSHQKIILFILIANYIGIIMLNFTYFDRYVIPLLILFILFLWKGKFEFKATLIPGVIVLAFIGLFAITETKNYLQRNAAIWESAAILEDKNIEAKHIDAGHEYNGWHGDKIDHHGKWDTLNKLYIITFKPLDDYYVTDSIKVNQGLIHKNKYLYILRKNN
jgi:hypothetical protein